jgi:hypothetical protein
MWDTLSLTRRWVCHLQLLLALASAVILGFQLLETRDHILLSQIRDFPFRRFLRVAWRQWRYATLDTDSSQPNFVYNNFVRTEQKTSFPTIPILLCVFADLLLITGSDNVACFFDAAGMRLISRCLAVKHSGFQASCHNNIQAETCTHYIERIHRYRPLKNQDKFARTIKQFISEEESGP